MYPLGCYLEAAEGDPMNDDRDVTFKLNGKRPDDFTIDRLAQYLRVLGELVGNTDKVRIKKISPGSVKVAMAIQQDYYPKFVERMTTAKNPKRAATKTSKIVEQLEQMVTDDHVTADVLAGTTKLISIRGYTRSSGSVLGPVIQRYAVRGKIIGLEGKDETKHARIAEYGTGKEIHGEFRDDALGELLTKHLWRGVVEIGGTARLFRHSDGRWELKAFRIDAVEKLDDSSPSQFVADLRAVFNQTPAVPDPVGDMKKLRG